jgi:hypothetical protein
MIVVSARVKETVSFPERPRKSIAILAGFDRFEKIAVFRHSCSGCDDPPSLREHAGIDPGGIGDQIKPTPAHKATRAALSGVSK